MTYFDPGNANDIVELAYKIAVENSSSYVTLEHLLLSLLKQPEVIEFCKKSDIEIQPLKKEVTNFVHGSPGVMNKLVKPKTTTEFKNIMELSIAQTIHNKNKVLNSLIILESILKCPDSFASYYAQKHGMDIVELEEFICKNNPEAEKLKNDKDEAENLLREFCVCLNDTVQQNKINPLIGRTEEVAELELILARKSKSNAVLVGPAGTGKSAIVEGVAKLVSEHKVSKSLEKAEFWSLEMGTLIAGTKYRGEMEERLKSIIDAITKLSDDGRNMILFIDEIHTMMGAGGSTTTSLDVGNMLKPSLARGNFKVIGATTEEEYRKYFEKDKAMSRRFQKIQVNEPSVKDAIEILMGLKPIYEKFHGVKYDKAAITEAVELSHRYINNRFLPDKAIDIIDISGAKAKLANEKKITKIDIEKTVSKIAKIPEKTVKENDVDRLKNLKKDLESNVIGQQEVIEEITDAIIMNRVGLRETGKPQGCYLFQGPTGSGKTELVKQMAKTLDMNLIRFDMSEFMEKHSVSKLIGTTAGYVGFDSEGGSGLLINEVEKNPYSIILLDEIEKAHKDIFNIFLQVFDDGRLTSGDGKTVSFENTIIIMTSNTGAKLLQMNPIGFNGSNSGKIDEAISNTFSPEFRNRLDAIVKFNSLSKEDMLKITDIELKKLSELLKKEKVKIKFTIGAKKYLSEKGFDPKMGARPLKRLIQNEVKKPISKQILFDNKKDFSVDVDENNNIIIS